MKRFNVISMALLGSAFLAYSSSVLAEDSSYGYSDSDPVYGNSTFGFGSEKQGGIDDSDKKFEEKIDRVARAQNYKEKKLLEMQEKLNHKKFSTYAGQQLIGQKYIEQEKKAGRYNEETRKKAEKLLKVTQERIKENQKASEAARAAIQDYKDHEEEHLQEYKDNIRQSLDIDHKDSTQEDQSFFYGE